MKKKLLVVSFIVIAVVLVVIFCANVLLYGGYNKNEVSKYMNITIDETVAEIYAGKEDGYEIYTSNLSEAYFVKKDASTITLQEALETKQITLKDMLSVCKQKQDGIYYAENYKIQLEGTKCTISPIN